MNIDHILFFLLILSIFSCLPCEPIEKKGSLDRMEEKLYPFEGYYDQKNYPDEQFNYALYKKSLKQATASAKTKSTGAWQTEGPNNIGGRVNAIAIDPTDDLTIYLGYSQGGLWKTIDGGANWNPIFEQQSYLSISSIEIDPMDSQVIYVGTGDHNISGYPFIGDGIYKSTNGGSSWNYIGLEETAIVSEIIVSKLNSDVIYAATMGLPFEKNNRRGLYKTTNGGQIWEQILFLNDSSGIIDIIVDPTNDRKIYAVGWNRIRNNKRSLISGEAARIYKSENGGSTWQTLTNGLPEGRLSRGGISHYGKGTDTLYAMFTANGGSIECNTSSIDLLGIYRSYDGGDNWTSIPTSENNGLNCNALGGFGWYFGKLAVNPSDPDDIFLLGIDLWRTRDGGQTWLEAAPPWWAYEVHADKHDLIFEGSDMYLATDGGAYKANINLEDWSDIESIPSTQFYRVALNPFAPNLSYGGAQDNGSTGGNIANKNDWPRIYGGDGFQMAFNPLVEGVFTTETQRGNINITYDNGLYYRPITFDIEGSRHWDMPYFMRKSNPFEIITGSDRVYRLDIANQDYTTTIPISPILTDPDPSAAFSQTISAVAESPIDTNIIMAGTSDGLLWITKNLGSDWINAEIGLPRRYVSCIAGSETNTDIFYVSYSGYRDNDNSPLLFKSDDGGDSWFSISGDLPMLSINNFEVLPDYEDKVIFVATDGGVYFTKNGGENWLRVGDMPVIPVYDIVYNASNNKLIAGTFARSIMSYNIDQLGLMISADRDIAKPIDFTLFPTLATDQLRIQGSFKQASIEILDQSGRLIKRKKLKSESIIIDVKGMPQGSYFARMISEEGIKTKTFFILK